MPDFTERNTQNAQHSTGPTSEEGRARSSENSRTHGLYARIPYTQEDQIEGYAAHKIPLMAALKPEDPLQEGLAKIVVDALWRVEGFRMKEAQRINFDSHPDRESRGRQEQRVLNGMFKALKTLQELQTQSKVTRAQEEDSRVRRENTDKIEVAADVIEHKDKEIANLKAQVQAERRMKDQLAGFVSHPSQYRNAAGPVPRKKSAETENQPSGKEENPAA
jgi:hypothetical protein